MKKSFITSGPGLKVIEYTYRETTLSFSITALLLGSTRKGKKLLLKEQRVSLKCSNILKMG